MIQAAERELTEETGFVAKESFKLVSLTYTSAGITDERRGGIIIHCSDNKVKSNTSDNEDITTHIFPIKSDELTFLLNDSTNKMSNFTQTVLKFLRILNKEQIENLKQLI